MRKIIPGFSQYEITDDGEVFNLRGMRMSQYDASGYKAIALVRDDGKRIGTGVHRLVVSAFIGEIPKGMWVNHKNGIKTDNRLENLEIDTPSHNHEHARDSLKRRYARGEETGARKLSEDAISAIGELSRLGWSQHRLASAFSVSQPAISNILNGKSWTQIPSLPTELSEVV